MEAMAEGLGVRACDRLVAEGATESLPVLRARALEELVTPRTPAPPGQTRLSPLGPLSRVEHRAKTHGGWALSQLAPGLYLWADRVGHRWVVIAGHTFRLPGTSSP